ncbi:hypothetical protein SteCoe_10715 [Stentor coeruleus]|uniref:Methyltransferase small domain-containing protein n=1 Tax=Stentor coeruleus TaxID=5963 RepID=A0A1R2CF20_9CILI|nr:hypothetical protein SteCoe_10715 [Stentor coeruleus]
MLIHSPFGQLRLLFPIYQKAGLQDIKYNKVTDNISHKVLFKRLKSEKSLEFIDERAIYGKIIAITRNLRRDFRWCLPSTSKCQTPKEIFHLYRRSKIEHAHYLARVGFHIDENYKVFLRGVPDIGILPSAIRTFLDHPQPIYMPINIFEGIVSANEWLEKGLHIGVLGEKIYPLYSVWPPTNQEYLKLFDSYLQSTSVKGTAVDLGCGTGILGFMLAKKGMSVFAVDSNFNAAKCANLNAQKLGLEFTAVHGNVKDIAIPECNILVCNPPWLPASAGTLLDRGSYDPNEELLCAAFMQTKKLKANGRFLLIYSDLAANIGLQNPGRIEELCKKHELVIRNMTKLPMSLTLDKEHPLKAIRDNSSIYFYEIVRL